MADHRFDDDDATRFLFYVSQALHHAWPDVGGDAIGLILENNLIDPTAVLSSLINDLAEIDDEIYLFLEDYHWISASRIHQTVAYFLKHAPPHCHVVLTTRTEPPLPLATLRAQNELIEIDSVALRFDMQETQAFLDSTKPGVLELRDIQLLQRRTEGWPAALPIVASMPSQSGLAFKEYVHDLSGLQRPIAAYLSEMLDALPVEMIDFMLRTAILAGSPVLMRGRDRLELEPHNPDITCPAPNAAHAARSRRRLVSLSHAAWRVSETEAGSGPGH